MSSEEQFEHIEHKIKEAAENNSIVFEENSWNKMEALLDKDDKRRPFLWLWFILPFMLIGSYVAYRYSNSANSNKTITTTINKKNTSKNDANQTLIAQQIPSNVKIPDTQNISNIPTPATINTTNKIASNNSIVVNNDFSSKQKEKYTNAKTSFESRTTSTLPIEKESANDDDLQHKNIKNSLSKTKASIKSGQASEDDVAVEKTNTSDTKIAPTQKNSTTKETSAKKDSNFVVLKKEKAENKKKRNFLSRFYVLGAYGADVGSVKLLSFKNSSISARYGAGIGYEFSKRLSAQTGFYASKKKYIAGPDDYHAKDGSYLSMINITQVDATCLVYEIPVSLRYNILNKKSFTFYTTAGASSYIMKKEDYNYTYKRYNTIYNRAYDYTGNQHLFSTALFSLGIEKNISKKFALQLEPMISVPLTGVGEGSVKLFSTSLQLGIKYNPFKK